jgi:hypothetical protein
LHRLSNFANFIFDGQKYEWSGGEVDIKSSAFGPGRQYDDIAISLVEDWRSMEGHKPLKLDAGKHTLSVEFVANPVGKNSEPTIHVVSNPVDIEILLKEKPVPQP